MNNVYLTQLHVSGILLLREDRILITQVILCPLRIDLSIHKMLLDNLKIGFGITKPKPIKILHQRSVLE